MAWKEDNSNQLLLLWLPNYGAFCNLLHFLTGSTTSGRHLPCLSPSSLWSVIPSPLPPLLRGGPKEFSLQISPINHKPESNITNILQLEETAVRFEPSISSPHDPRLAGPSDHSFGRGPCRKWEKWDRVVLMERAAGTKPTADLVSERRKTVVVRPGGHEPRSDRSDPQSQPVMGRVFFFCARICSSTCRIKWCNRKLMTSINSDRCLKCGATSCFLEPPIPFQDSGLIHKNPTFCLSSKCFT